MTYPSLPAAPGAAHPPWLTAELRSDHAGETGAVMIYKGMLSVAKDPEVRRFATDHLATEVTHLALIEDVLPTRQHSVFLPLWKIAGRVTGMIPALMGREWVFHTIDAVETFVDRHYQHQIDALEGSSDFNELRELLIRCQADEIHHRDEARNLAQRNPSPALRAWVWLVGVGSSAAVSVARRL